MITLKKLDGTFSVCKLNSSPKEVKPFHFLSVTDEEISLLCPSNEVPEDAYALEENFEGLRIEGVLDFSLVGILAPIASLLAKAQIPVFVVSTFNTDYIFLKSAFFKKASILLKENGYPVL